MKVTIKRFLAAFMAAFFSAISCAGGVEIGLTQTKLTQQPDGIWCQYGVSDCAVRLNVTGAYLGGVWDRENADRIHVGVWYMGHPTSDGLAVPDGAYDSAAHSCIGACPYKSHFKTAWNIWGIRALYERKTALLGWPLSLYGGGYLYTETGGATVDDWWCGQSDAPQSWCGPKLRQVKHNWRVPCFSPVVGIGGGPFSLLLTYPVRTCGEGNRPNNPEGGVEQMPAINKGPALSAQISWVL